MPEADLTARVGPADVERWLHELGLEPGARADRDGVSSWDLRLDGRRRFDLPVTLILDPALALICWVHFAPPIADAYRKSYRKLLRWNDEYPFVKFSLAEDERPVLATELAIDEADRDALGVALARSLAIADELLEESASWLWIGGRIPEQSGRVSRGAGLLDRYADRLGELVAGSDAAVGNAAASDVAHGDAPRGDAAPGDAAPGAGPETVPQATATR